MQNKDANNRVLVLSSTFPRWKNDVEPPFVYELCRRLVKQGYTVDILAPHTAGSKTVEILDELTVYRYRYFFESYQNLAYDGGILASLKQNKLLYLLIPFFLAAQFFYTWKLLRRGNYHLVHAHWIIPQGLIAAIAVTMAGKKTVPVVCTSHGGDLFALDSMLFNWLKRWTLSRMRLLTVVSEPMKRHCQRHLGKYTTIEVCPMGVDLTGTFTPPAETSGRQNNLIFVGRLVAGKGLYCLLHAVRILLDRGVNPVLNVLGEGPERESIMQEMERLQLNDNVRLHGAVSNETVPEHLRNAAIAVIPSLGQEGLGLVAIEAMGCECVVVASSFDAIKEIIIDGENGMIFPSGDAEALADKIELLINDTQLQGRLASRGRQSVLASYDWSVVTDNYLRIFEKCRSNQIR